MTDNTFLKKLSRTFFAGLVACLFIGTATTAAHAACATNEIDVLGDGTQCEESKFEITTTNDTSKFLFRLGAEGTFYVDWGDGVVDVINTTAATDRSHTYASTGSYTIRFSGTATGYGGWVTPAISFYKQNNGTQDKIAGARGRINDVFPGGRFRELFRGATNLTAIPPELFRGIVYGRDHVFEAAFKDCTSLTSIPDDLFEDVERVSNSAFAELCSGCTSLESIPTGLFDGIITNGGGVNGLFWGVFQNCTRLTRIPSGLFDDILSTSSNWTDAHDMFRLAFAGCTSLTTIPEGIFSNISAGKVSNAANMFYLTFNGCTSLQSLPNGLFSNLDIGKATNTTKLFQETFNGCTSLQSLGTGLFNGVNVGSSTNTNNMFNSTFSKTSISAIPNGLFNSIDTSNSTDTNYMFNGTFSNTNISAIPNGLFNSIDTSNSTNTSNMFRSTFYNTNISAIPNGLFNSIDTSNSTDTNYMFYSTFSHTNISAIPNGLFNSIDTSNSTDTNNMFNSTFYNTNISAIPNGLFNSIDTSNSTNTSSMFKNTFNSTRVSTIPTGLFDNIDTSNATNTNNMFRSTFKNTQITSIPAGMFTTIDTSSATNTNEMFRETFANCTSLTGYIPPTAFPNTITPGSSSSTNMWNRTFSGTQLATVCPAGTTEYNTGFQNDWGYSNGNTTTSGTYRVSCEPCTNTLPENATWTVNTCNWTCDNGYTANNNICAVTVCTGATYYDITYPSGCAPCPDGYDYNTESGKTSISQCQIQCPAGTYIDGGAMYTQLEYIETTGTQYIDTGLVPANLVGPVVTTTLQYTSTARSQQNGIRNVNSMYLMFGTSGTSDRFVIQGSGGGTETLFGVPDTNKHTFVIDTLNRTCAIDNDVRALNVGDLSKLTKSIYIGNANGQSRANYAKYYNVNIISDDVVVMNLIPVRRDSDNGIGMYDTVTGAFFPNVGTGDFVAGPDSGVCVNVGTGYWSAASTVNYGSVGVRNACTDVGDGSYTNSDVGAAANTDCYKTCTVAVANIAHALTVNGNDYYGGANTCSVATCENGYHVDNNACTANEITINWSNASAADIDANEAGTVTYGGDIRTPRAAEIIPGKVFLGWKFSAPGE